MTNNKKRYLVDFNTGAGNAEFDDLNKAINYAEQNAAYTGKHITIIDQETEKEVMTSIWYGVKYNPDTTEDEPMADFGDYGYYTDWIQN